MPKTSPLPSTAPTGPEPPIINRTVLMSGARHFSVVELNPYSNAADQPDLEQTTAEHATIRRAFASAGIRVATTPAPAACQDGVYTANWGLCRGDTVVLSSLPGPRKAEETYAEDVLRDLGKRVIKPPYRFSGQGDALPLGDGRRLLAASGYRTDPRMHKFLADELGYEIIPLQAVPARDTAGQPITNPLTGWPDSFFYDIDLALSALRPDLIAWCPEAFTPQSQETLRHLPGVTKIEVDYTEATKAFACNLVSTGHTVIMSAHAPKLRTAIESHGLRTITPKITELAKGGGYIRCIALTLDNS